MTFIPRKRFVRIVCFLSAGFIFSLLMCGSIFKLVQAQEPYSENFVYTESNIPTENSNTILGFSQDKIGNLIPLPNSPFPTGGAGIADPTFTEYRGVAFLLADNDQEVIVDHEHNRLFAVNSGSNTIAVFNIKQNGTLVPVSGSPFPSGGVNPVSLGLAEDKLYVVNKNLDINNPTQDAEGSQPNYTGFRVTSEGRLIPIPGSTVSIPSGSTPTQALISRNKKILFGLEYEVALLRSLRILPDGRLVESPNSPQPLPASEFPPGGPPPVALGLQVHPKLPILYTGFLSTGKIGVYNYNPVTGELTFVKAVPSSGQGPCWLIINHQATRLYVANTDDNSVSVFDLADPITPKEIQRVTIKQNFAAATELTFNSNESLLQVVDRRTSGNILEGNAIDVFKVNPTDGTLSEIDNSPFPIESVNGSFPQGLVTIPRHRL